MRVIDIGHHRVSQTPYQSPKENTAPVGRITQGRKAGRRHPDRGGVRIRLMDGHHGMPALAEQYLRSPRRNPQAGAKLPVRCLLLGDFARDEMRGSDREWIGRAVVLLEFQPEYLLESRILKTRRNGHQTGTGRHSVRQPRHVLVRVGRGIRQPDDRAIAHAA